MSGRSKHIVIPPCIDMHWGMGDILNSIQLGVQLANNSRAKNVTLYKVIAPYCQITRDLFFEWTLPILTKIAFETAKCHSCTFVIADFFTDKIIKINSSSITNNPTLTKGEQDVYNELYNKYHDPNILLQLEVNRQKYLETKINNPKQKAIPYIPVKELEYLPWQSKEGSWLVGADGVKNDNITLFNRSNNPTLTMLVENPSDKAKHKQYNNSHLKSVFKSLFIDWPKLPKALDERNMLYFAYKRNDKEINEHNDETFNNLLNCKWILGPEGGIMHFSRLAGIPYILVIPTWILQQQKPEYFDVWIKQNPFMKNTKVMPIGFIAEQDLKHHFSEKYEMIDRYIDENKSFKYMKLFSDGHDFVKKILDKF